MRPQNNFDMHPAEGMSAPADRRLLTIGVVMLALGIVVPSFLTVERVGIYQTLETALQQQEKIYVILAALKLVFLNTVRAVPHYLGAFFLAEAINGWKIKGRSVLSIAVICVTVPAVYFIIENLYGIHYDFGVPALSMLTLMLVFSKIRFDFVNLTKKILMLVLLILSIQFLDVMPLLRGLPIGRGESSYDIKLFAEFLGAQSFLQNTAWVCFGLFLFVAVLVLALINDENNIKRISELKEQNEHALMETRMRILEDRTYMELNHLVHDLKSPLTSMQALVGIVKLSCETHGHTQEVGYLEKIESNIERMSSMISEILYEDHFTISTTHELITALLAQTSSAEYAEMLHADNQAPQLCVEVNAIRFSRALVNLIENSFYAVDKKNGMIWLTVTSEELNGRPGVCFTVKDNGVGIDQELLSRVWTKGFSTRNSHGLGLSFVALVVEKSGGSIDIRSTSGNGTEVKILLPAYEERARD